MKISFNQASALGCRERSMMTILEAADKSGFDGVDLHAGLLDECLKEQSVNELAKWFNTHHLKPSSYSAFFSFNWKRSEKEKQKVFTELTKLIPVFDAIGLKTIVLIPSMNIAEQATVSEIRDDAAEMLNRMADLCDPHGIRLALEFIGSGSCTINRFDTAYEIVTTVDRESVGLSVDLFHFHALASSLQDLARSDGRKIFNVDMDDVEDVPIGAPYLSDQKRLWPGDGCIDKKGFADSLKASGCDLTQITGSVEVFRPEYYELSVDDNVETAYEKARAFVDTYLA